MPRRRRPPRSGAITELPPLRILSQIAAIQCIYYAAALVLMVFTSLVAGTGFDLDLVFGWASLRGDTTQGWLFAFVWLCCAGAVVMALVAFVARSKLVPDFAMTLHFIHLCVVTLYTGFLPRNAMWWVTMLASCGTTAALGVWGCQWRELRPINFGGRGSAGNNNGGGGGNSSGAAENGDDSGGGGGGHDGGGDEEMGFGRGRGRGRGRDGAGEYEMVGLKPGDPR